MDKQRCLNCLNATTEGGRCFGPHGSAFMAMADSNSKIEEILRSGLDMIVKRGKAEVEKRQWLMFGLLIAALCAGPIDSRGY